jgi:hypothetical protein
LKTGRNMHDLLVHNTFDKARIELEPINGNASTKSKYAQLLSDYLLDNNFPYSAKSLSNPFNALIIKRCILKLNKRKS